MGVCAHRDADPVEATHFAVFQKMLGIRKRLPELGPLSKNLAENSFRINNPILPNSWHQ